MSSKSRSSSHHDTRGFSESRNRAKVTIKEEAEPCELHDIVNCKKCQRAEQERLENILKRSISMNAIPGRNASSTVPRKLHRSSSQTSCYSTGSTQSVPVEMQNDSFSELLYYFSSQSRERRDPHTANIFWDLLPIETKQALIRKIINNKKRRSNKNLVYNDFRSLLLLNETNYQPSTSKCTRSRPVSLLSPKEQLASQLIGQLFDSISSESDPESDACYIPNVGPNAEQLDTFSDAQTALENIRIWRDRQEINAKIKEVNLLIERFEKMSPSPTPASTDDSQKHKTLSSNAQAGNLAIPKQQQQRQKTQLKFLFQTNHPHQDGKKDFWKRWPPNLRNL
ncbi:uncharacterized protein KNAG_0B04540 [Huiozyma naganishii CBS 8797]|uniref:Uncharacterized protein n=1 Tax=Huiozyma naganishii (strain ATCC MYA-139 / BCRC 22969 / CBS 8797 / KCTC 17520 / NBRC 10181 / NCYC 3082 / Yp74L-3) TaxID=1071383 RepID=J7RH73_HUIN7|nr:hypothetical protein KNAG_0B04540 [Kazachstania naganishii CBS 8797]CCK68888.1 hypothetical protein KNAG_0B04540 [Kazachstania naganishii CBS 8797]